MFDFDIVSFIPRAVMQGIPLLYGSTGEILLGFAAFGATLLCTEVKKRKERKA